ncbi:MAG: hypothetical protein ACPGEF_03675, partial [Endozoicomonas sp.]
QSIALIVLIQRLLSSMPNNPPFIFSGSFVEWMRGGCQFYNDVDLITTMNGIKWLSVNFKCMLEKQGYIVKIEQNTGIESLKVPEKCRLYVTRKDNQHRTILTIEANFFVKNPETLERNSSLLVSNAATPVKKVEVYYSSDNKTLKNMLDTIQCLNNALLNSTSGLTYEEGKRVIIFNRMTEEKFDKREALLMRAIMTAEKSRKLLIKWQQQPERLIQATSKELITQLSKQQSKLIQLIQSNSCLSEVINKINEAISPLNGGNPDFINQLNQLKALCGKKQQ